LWVAGGARITADVPSMVDPELVAKMPVGDACIAASTIATPTAAWSLWCIDQRVSVRTALLANPRIGEPTAMIGWRWLVARGDTVPFHLVEPLGADTVAELLAAADHGDDVHLAAGDVEAWAQLVGTDTALSLQSAWADPLVFHWLDHATPDERRARWGRCDQRRRAAYAEHTLATALRRPKDLMPASVLTAELCELFAGLLGDLHPDRVGDRDTPLVIEDLDAFEMLVDGAAMSAAGIDVLRTLETRAWMSRGIGFSFAGRVADLAAGALISDAFGPADCSSAGWLCERVSPAGADVLLSTAAGSPPRHPIREQVDVLLTNELPARLVADTLTVLSHGHGSDPLSALRRWARGGFARNQPSSDVFDLLWERCGQRGDVLAALAPAYESWWERRDICERIAGDDAALSVLVAAKVPPAVLAAVAAPFGGTTPAASGPAATLLDALDRQRDRGPLTAAALLTHADLPAMIAPRAAVAAGMVETFVAGEFARNPMTDESFEHSPTDGWLVDYTRNADVFAKVSANRSLSPGFRLDAALFAASASTPGAAGPDCTGVLDETLRRAGLGDPIVDVVSSADARIVGCWLAGHYVDTPTPEQVDTVLATVSAKRSPHGVHDVIVRYAEARSASPGTVPAAVSDRAHRWVAATPGVFTLTSGPHTHDVWGLFVDIAASQLGDSAVLWRLFCELGDGSPGSLVDVLDLVAAAA
jgi:hypothetical protein